MNQEAAITNQEATPFGAKIASMLYGPQGAGNYYADPQAQQTVDTAIQEIATETIQDTNPQDDIDGKWTKQIWGIMAAHSKINPLNPTAEQKNDSPLQNNM